MKQMKEDSKGRRKFIKQSALGISGITFPVVGNSSFLPTNSIESDVIRTETDVLVIGGGTAGTIAAIQSARAGTKTAILERSGQLGGTTTLGGVAFPGLFNAWGKQIIAGIGWELVRESVLMDGGELPDFTKPVPRHWHHQINVNQFLYFILAEDKCIKEDVSIIYYEFPDSVEKQEEGWIVNCVGPGTKRQIKCKQIVDCTGGADIVGMIGLARLREDETQPGSLLFKFDDAYNPGREQLKAVYVHGADSSNSRTRTRANIKGRQEILKQLGSKRLIHVQPETAFRESFRIVGETVISHEDYISGKVFKDAICFAFYPVDLHTKDGVQPKYLTEGVIPTIPLKALIPKNSENILVAGRCVSSDRLANSGLRVQASCMAMGQAAGAAAALAVIKNKTPLKIPIHEIRKLLTEHGAIVPPV